MGCHHDTMMLVAIVLIALVFTATIVSADVVLNEKIMTLALRAAQLSALAYEENPPPADYIEDNFGYFDEEPDQALVAKVNGYCFGAFRGTTLTWIDWQQNFNPGKQEICKTSTKGGDITEDCCMSRSGFYEGYWTEYKDEFEKAIRDCAKSCSNIDECVVLTGHSQGGAIAAVSALPLVDLNPYVITFGQPNTLDAPCDLVASSRWYRFINTKENPTVGLSYDPVPFVPGLGADSFGHMILLSNDDTGVAYIGLDAQDSFGPLNVAGFEAHSMISTTEYPGYLDRLKSLMANATYPIRTTGYVANSFCTQAKECETKKCEAETHYSFHRCVGADCTKDKDCPETGRCDSGICLPKLGSCEGCDEDSDCAGGKCILFHCSGSSGKMDNNCICKWGADCESGRCEGIAPSQCEAQLGLDASCNENSDCKSGHCGWNFRCTSMSRETNSALSAALIPAPVGKKRRTGLIICLSVMGAALLILVLGFLFVSQLIGWIRGYEEVPTIATEAEVEDCSILCPAILCEPFPSG